MRGRIIHVPGALTSMLAAPLLAACAPTPASAPGCDAAFDEAGVVAVLEQQREAWNRADLEGFLAGYEPSEQLLFTSGGNIRRGFTQTRDKYRARYGTAAETMGTLAFEILDVRPLGSCKDAAIVLGRWQLTDTPSAGQGVFSVMLERHGERWEIVHDHTSAELAAGVTGEPAKGRAVKKSE